MPWARVNSLIDGIYGFAATVLMLRLATPVYREGDLGPALADQAPYYLLYALGFVQIVAAWSVLRRLASWSTGIDFYGMLLGFVALMMWATTPFTIDVLAGAVDNAADFASAMRLLCVTLMVSMVGYVGLFLRQERCGYFRQDLDPDVFGFARIASYTTIVWPATAFALSYVSGWASLAVLTGFIALTLAPLDAMSTEQYDAAEA
jgi:hypothetical protein